MYATYSRRKKIRLEHTVTIDEIWLSLYRQPERDQAYERRRCPIEKSSSMAMLSKFGSIRNRYWGHLLCRILAESETMNAAPYLEFLEKKKLLAQQ